ncbi:MAG: hypothetical protein OZSIB_0589 [Candidatus Ozemobacter sibiricus]|uniref:DUF2877 domain-containing protein n=1 Tax=Candidatus Ozemobacter sibiricus TaxID=2268124 RepID=A0A367ZTH9_9BACT|nr:MAG: hypothetical protein OZSIB_0589 [Candidatus Ozemobacter sibiricus]
MFRHGAIVWLDSAPLFLTSDPDLVHPLAVLVPDQAWMAAATSPLLLDPAGILALGPWRWERGPDLLPPDRPTAAAPGLLTANTRLLRRCLPLATPRPILMVDPSSCAQDGPGLKECPPPNAPPAPNSSLRPLPSAAPIHTRRQARPAPTAECPPPPPGEGSIQNQAARCPSPTDASAGSGALLEAFLGRTTNEFTHPLAALRQALRAPTIARPPEAGMTTAGALAGRPPIDLAPFATWFGRGTGSTPSWDDLITGLLLADRWLGPPCRVRLSDALLPEIRARTSPVAWHQLAMAAHGLTNLRWERFLHSFCTQPLSPAAILAAARHGHASGAEILAGVLLRLESESLLPSSADQAKVS